MSWGMLKMRLGLCAESWSVSPFMRKEIRRAWGSRDLVGAHEGPGGAQSRLPRATGRLELSPAGALTSLMLR